MCSGVTCGPGRRETSSPSTSAIAARPGTWSRISWPESAGTAAPVAGSSRIEMVPPVKRMGTTEISGRGGPAPRAGAGGGYRLRSSPSFFFCMSSTVATCASVAFWTSSSARRSSSSEMA